ncbi:unnamed protein product [Hydatigera taeniaeformis]|uniref:palmitoyl-protein hydrolase n=1 Tax=Hydatigena taeniaeformis TaxID=6205 RepID=A0A0R3WLZ0_HYDTA|nr:unnamed protein product [Hydatigera taeniaeformis]
MALLPAEIIESRTRHTASLIFLHGLGDNGYVFGLNPSNWLPSSSGWADTLRNVVPPYCKIVCPNARDMPVTLNMGMVMPAWYDLYNLGIGAKEDESGILEATKEVAKWVAAEKTAGISADRIVVGGFSQGGSIAFYYGMTNVEQKLGGLVALSCWLPLHEKFVSNSSVATANRSMPILQCHGKVDPIVPYELGTLTNSILRKLGFANCSFSSYQGMGHCSCSNVGCLFTEFMPSWNWLWEIADVKTFLSTCLPPANG